MANSPAQDGMVAQVAATIAVQAAAAQKIAALESKVKDQAAQITALQGQLAAVPPDDTPLLTQLTGELKASSDTLQADIAAAA